MTTSHDVVVIGAGAAGIAAAARLQEAGRRVLLVEASTRIGGRAWTETIDGMAIDLGCGWLHSADRNPMVALAERSGFAVDRSRSAWGEQYRDLSFSAAEQEAAHRAWERFEHRIETAPPPSDRAGEAMPVDDPWRGYAEALSGYMNGAELDRLSIADFLAYDTKATDHNWRVPAGYGALVAAQLPAAAMALATAVTEIALTRDGVRIVTDRGSIEAAAAVVTVSTNVLAGGAIALPQAARGHVEAASRLPLGLADKLFLALDGEHGLAAETHLIGDPRRAETGSYYMRPFGRPMIEAFFGGRGAVMLEREGLGAAVAFALDELAGLLGSGIRRHLRPMIGSSWCRMTHVRGSYSHALPGHADARGVLATPIEDRLFFAGEATHPFDFSTAHGAWESGERAAGEVVAVLGG
ncbi:monoamine oxidase [Sphingomonas jinjuensis]|uniref:Tryptophan 2-monooxygenase n=1 Tax=Sphingomonas jinjuensis TaxID=535907 RepID=A0A840F8D0_9SPHN|nr:monoamine oxidase [Sphingomonas jinjuensis]